MVTTLCRAANPVTPPGTGPCAEQVNPAPRPERSVRHVTRAGGDWWTGRVTTDDDDLATLTPLRGIDRRRSAAAVAHRAQEPALWFVTVTLSGRRMRPGEGAAGASSGSSEEQPFLVSARYASSRAEVRYWDESVDVEGAVAQALRLWRDHESTAGLPPWTVVGLEVVDRDTARRRWRTRT